MASHSCVKTHSSSHSSLFRYLFLLLFITSIPLVLQNQCTATAIPTIQPPHWGHNGDPLPASGDILSVVVRINNERDWPVKLSLFAGSRNLPKGPIVNQAEIVWAISEVFCVFYIADDNDNLDGSGVLRDRTPRVRKEILSQWFTNDNPLIPEQSFLAKRLACTWIH